MKTNSKAAILFYDSNCDFCSFWVKLILKYSKKQDLFFSPLSGETYQKSGGPQFMTPEKAQALDGSLVYLKDNQFYSRSDAVIEIIRDNFWLGSIFIVAKMIPRLIRDYFYSLTARNRHKFSFIIGQQCFVPDPEQKRRFLD